MRLAARVHGRSYRFRSVCDVLARAGEPKAGDARAGLGAASHLERAAARCVLAELTLADLRAHPPRATADEVTRALDAGVHEAAYADVRGLRVGELRDWLLADTTSAEQIRRAGRGLTAEMAAAVTKLCSNLDLMYGARRMPVTTRARTTLGQRGRLATRLRTGHPRDDHRGITAIIYEGLAYGCGDALIAVDPGADDPASIRALLDLTHDLITRLQIPTQNCVLAGPMTQIRALEQGAPLDVFFQRLAGTEAGLRALGTSVTLLDDARALAHERGALRGTQVLYFTAGQGHEAGTGHADGVDQTTRGARALALARRYNPLLVEIVAGPAGDGREMVRGALEDHFIGKLLGVPLGVD
jgi:ethanolamine ammonia-lyase large subunit